MELETKNADPTNHVLESAFESLEEELHLNRRFRSRSINVLDLLELDEEPFVHWVYVALLDRLPDLPGKQAYLSYLRDGRKTKLETILSIRSSKEAQTVGKILYAGAKTNLLPVNCKREEAEAAVKLGETRAPSAPILVLLPEKSDKQLIEWLYATVLERYPTLDEEQSALVTLSEQERSRYDWISEFSRLHFAEIRPELLTKLPLELSACLQASYLSCLAKQFSELRIELQEAKKSQNRTTIAIADCESTIRTFKFAFSLQDRLLEALEKAPPRSGA